MDSRIPKPSMLPKPKAANSNFFDFNKTKNESVPKTDKVECLPEQKKPLSGNIYLSKPRSIKFIFCSLRNEINFILIFIFKIYKLFLTPKFPFEFFSTSRNKQ